MRATFPEYIRWQNAMRPEDIGHHDGLAGTTVAVDDADHYEAKVARHLGSLMGVVRNCFADEEHRMWAEYKTRQAIYTRLKAAIESQDNSGRPVRATLKRIPAVGLTVTLGVAAAGLLGLMLSLRGLELAPAVALAVMVGAGLIALSYASGVILRQSSHQWARNTCVGLAVVTGAILLIAVSSMPTPQLTDAERLLIGGGIVLCCVGIGVCAFYSHDPNPEATRLEREYSAVHAQMAQLVSKRNESRVFHLNVALRHRELAGEMIAAYRLAFKRSAPPDTPEPRSFARALQLAEVDTAWFCLHEENTI